jgi:hypothetical protein
LIVVSGVLLDIMPLMPPLATSPPPPPPQDVVSRATKDKSPIFRNIEIIMTAYPLHSFLQNNKSPHLRGFDRCPGH